MAAPLPARPSLTKLQRVRIFDGNEGKCHLCGRPINGTREKWEADHVQARWKGGSDKIGNFKPAHVACHAEKSAAETTQRAKADAQRATYIAGHKPDPKTRIKQRPKQPRPVKEALPFPARRSLYV